MDEPHFSIAAVERDTGLSKDLLRMWERRYGFPEPARDAHGERIYPATQVDRLRLIKRLLGQGHRPGKLVALPVEALAGLATRRPDPAVREGTQPDEALLDGLLLLVTRHDANRYVQALQQQLARTGLAGFVQDIAAPLARRVGMAWEQGRLEVFEEHLFTELTKRVLRQAIAALPQGSGAPRVLLTTVPNEQHLLGLLMIEALLALEGAHCIPLGTQMPLLDISRAAAAHRADIVALSFSEAFPARHATRLLEQLRAALPSQVALWAGGSGVLRVEAPPGVARLASLSEGMAALEAWRLAHEARLGGT